jgi:hypothetical protein
VAARARDEEEAAESMERARGLSETAGEAPGQGAVDDPGRLTEEGDA